MTNGKHISFCIDSYSRKAKQNNLLLNVSFRTNCLQLLESAFPSGVILFWIICPGWNTDSLISVLEAHYVMLVKKIKVEENRGNLRN